MFYSSTFHMCNISPLLYRLCVFWCCVLTLLPLTTADEAEKPVSDEDDGDFTFASRTERTCRNITSLCILCSQREVVDRMLL